ncbi:MAG TPA: DinB family protein [Verrucomicrobiae bacterium]|nr:DinB family protein [Verrucomicrobiae bacterium]
MRVLVLIVMLTASATGQTATANPQIESAKKFYDYVKSLILKSADKMPEDKYPFKPAPEVMSYGLVLAHLANAQFYQCSTAMGEKTIDKGFHESLHTKIEILAGLKEGFAYCDAAFAKLTDAKSAEMVDFFGARVTKLAGLNNNTSHMWEHYGNLVTYMRINGIVPPSSDPQK